MQPTKPNIISLIKIMREYGVVKLSIPDINLELGPDKESFIVPDEIEEEEETDPNTKIDKYDAWSTGL